MKIGIKISSDKIYGCLLKQKSWVIVMLGFVLVLFTIFAYYKYIYLTISSEPSFQVEKVNINVDVLEKVLEHVEKREDALEEIRWTNYSDPFSD